MKNNHSNGKRKEFRPTWYLALLVWPAITALLFIVAGNPKDQPSDMAHGQPGFSATASTVVSDASTGKATAR